jgi:hypothetical protein
VIRHALAMAVAFAIGVSPAHADTLVELPKTRAQLVVPDGWHKLAVPALLAAYKHTDGSILAVARADVPNPDAWRPEVREGYADEIERGIATSVPGYRRLTRKLSVANGIPALDVEARRGDVTLIFRVLLFRTYALALAIEVPPGGRVEPARAIAVTFAPPKDP